MFSFDRPAGVRINALYLKPMRAPQPAPLILIKGRQRSSAKVNLFFVLGRPLEIRGRGGRLCRRPRRRARNHIRGLTFSEQLRRFATMAFATTARATIRLPVSFRHIRGTA
jgi:hypothetical protein